MNYLRCIIIGLIVSLPLVGFSQSNLDRNISLQVSRQKLADVLEIISNKGNFYFSYNTRIIPRDSLVSISVLNRPLRQVLAQLLNDTYEFRESGNYIIIRKRPIQLTIVTNKAVSQDKNFIVTGYVLDENTGSRVQYASIYEKKLLAAALTDERGFFRLKLKTRAKQAELTVSKEFYEDTTVVIEPRYNQEVTITIVPLELEAEQVYITPEDYLLPDSLMIRRTEQPLPRPMADTLPVEKSRLARWLISPKQKIQSINLRRFFTDRPFQVSVIPGVGTQGKLGAQVVNNFSLNLLGGYVGGVNVIEVGGLVNLDKENVQYVQVGGLANIVGGNVRGLQIGGLSNTVLKRVTGLQIGGVNNYVKDRLIGLQIAGVYNHGSDTVTGLQLAGVGNFVKQKVSGVQLAGVANISNRHMSGLQIAGLLNYAKRMNGVQIGLINISDTSNGYSIGLINIVMKGYHKLSISTNEILNFNAAFKTGNSKLYSILQAGMHVADKDDDKLYSFGYGLGWQWRLANWFSINPELTSQYLYMGSWNHLNLLNKVHLNFNISFGKYISIFGGPSIAGYYSTHELQVNGYKFQVPPPGTHTFSIRKDVTGWIGWNAGINFF